VRKTDKSEKAINAENNNKTDKMYRRYARVRGHYKRVGRKRVYVRGHLRRVS
jgi:uncharacterized protein with PIN domain